jgi:hypothetical protein
MATNLAWPCIVQKFSSNQAGNGREDAKGASGEPDEAPPDDEP